MTLAIHKVETAEGWELFDGDPADPKSIKLAVVGCRQFSGDSVEKTVGAAKVSVPVHKVLPPEHWSVHLTAPSMKYPLFLAIAAALPKEAPPPHPLLAGG